MTPYFRKSLRWTRLRPSSGLAPPLHVKRQRAVHPPYWGAVELPDMRALRTTGGAQHGALR